MPNSFFITPIVAIHGVYNDINVIKLNATLLVNIIFIVSAKVLKFELYKTLSVLSIASFADIPVIIAVVILQSVNPIGLKKLLIFIPIPANILFSSET
mgnify:CR=1 FL=1